MSLLELRNQMKRKKPKFIRTDAVKKRLKKRWVRARGLHSKIRLKKAGHQKKVSNGYGSPKKVRGLSRDGFIQVIVFNENELGAVNKEKEGIIIAKNVGAKNKVSLLKKAKEKGIKVLNLNIDEYIKKKEEEIKKRLQKKRKKEEEKEKKKEKKKDEKKKEKLEERLSDEEKKEKEKKEKDKLLTKREVQ